MFAWVAAALVASSYGTGESGVLAPPVHLPGYGALESETSLLSTFDDTTVMGLTMCSFFVKNPGTCHPRALHSPCAYCRVKNRLKIMGHAFMKGACPGKESFVPGYEHFVWRLADKKFSRGWRVCVVEEDPMAAAVAQQMQAQIDTGNTGEPIGQTLPHSVTGYPLASAGTSWSLTPLSALFLHLYL
eukprot:Gregarina_sp_Poly_1__3875@NODE_215_length_11293_cov_58_142259_g191_i0_p8_GENE_NODE_215_length_11293_cov_58_142259_g191_i0NODE_215_length_11293_cov_58_142259_g191_i0_p8_ORF_typecomplete_len187_score14_30_NODE_215_length_11293_cov_58_142259_g191_i078108370